MPGQWPDEPLTHVDGMAARADGLTISACPAAPGDPAGARWRAGWIEAEAIARSQTGTFGATPDQYQAAGLAHRRVATTEERIAAYAAKTKTDVDELRTAMQELARNMAKAFRPVIKAMADFAARLLAATDATQVSASVLDPTRAHKPCPRHGPTVATGGLCRPCQRDLVRRRP